MIKTSKKNPTATQKNQKVAENFQERKKERKPRERVLPNPIPDQTPVCFTGSKQSPTTRAPTRTPSGEKGPEDSWLRLLSRSDENLPQDRPNRSSL